VGVVESWLIMFPYALSIFPKAILTNAYCIVDLQESYAALRKGYMG